MNELKVLHYPNETLLKRAKEVEVIDNNIRNLISSMITVMLNEKGIGLAANQVGVLKRICIIKTKDERILGMINPEIVEKEALAYGKEGCLSFPGIGIDVERNQRVKVNWLNESGEKMEEIFEEMDAICIQHEIDHLDGIVFVDKLKPVKKQMVLSKYKKLKK